MKLKNILIVVKNIERARQFYHDHFGLEVLLKRDGNVILTEGLVLQDEGIWKIGKEGTWQTDDAGGIIFLCKRGICTGTGLSV